MTRKFTQFAVFALAILLAELLQSYAHHFFDEKFVHGHAYKKVMLSMLITLLVFYPIFHFVEKYIKSATEKYVEGTMTITRNRLTGLLIGFAIAITLIFAGFAKV